MSTCRCDEYVVSVMILPQNQAGCTIVGSGDVPAEVLALIRLKILAKSGVLALRTKALLTVQTHLV